MLLSILGLYNHDKTIFDAMVLPDGVDRDIVINNILLECAEFEVIYPSWPAMAFGIEYWSKKELPVWRKLYDTTVLEYDPLTNYRSTINESISSGGNENETIDRTYGRKQTSSSEGESHRNSEIERTFDRTDNLTSQNVPYNDSDFQDYSKDSHAIQDFDDTTDTTTVKDNVSNTTDITDSDITNRGKEDERSSVKESKSEGMSGNRIVQEMVDAERQTALFNIYDTIIDSFKKRFCLLVY